MILCTCQIIENVFCSGSFGRFAIKLRNTSHLPIFWYLLLLLLLLLLLFLFLLILIRLIRRLDTRKSLFLNADTAHKVQENLISQIPSF